MTGLQPFGRTELSTRTEGLDVIGDDLSDKDQQIEEIESPKTDPGGPQFSSEEHRAKTTKLLMVLSFTALCFLFIAHLFAILYLAHDKPNAVDEVTRVFGTWVPIFSTLVGSAATYYFTRERR